MKDLFLINLFIAFHLPYRLFKTFHPSIFTVSNSFNCFLRASFVYSINIDSNETCVQSWLIRTHNVYVIVYATIYWRIFVMIGMNAALYATETKRDFKRGVLKWWIVWGLAMVEKGYWRVKRPWKIVNQYEPSRLDYNPQHWTCSLFRCFRDS